MGSKVRGFGPPEIFQFTERGLVTVLSILADNKQFGLSSPGGGLGVWGTCCGLSWGLGFRV